MADRRWPEVGIQPRNHHEHATQLENDALRLIDHMTSDSAKKVVHSLLPYKQATKILDSIHRLLRQDTGVTIRKRKPSLGVP